MLSLSLSLSLIVSHTDCVAAGLRIGLTNDQPAAQMRRAQSEIIPLERRNFGACFHALITTWDVIRFLFQFFCVA